MPKLEKMGAIARKILPVIYVLDTSGSMYGTRISTVNQAMTETIEVLKDVASKNPTAEIKIGVLQFSCDAAWVTPENELVFMDDFFWNNLIAAGTTNLTSALNELFDKLSRSAFLNDDVGYKLPVIIFMSDGEPNDDSYGHALKRLEANNNWFKYATKIAIAIDDECDIDILAQVTGNKESVIQVSDMDSLKKLIKVVSATASLIGVKSRTDSDSTHDVINTVKGEMGGKAKFFDPSPSDTTLPPDDSGSDDGWGNTGDWT